MKQFIVSSLLVSLFLVSCQKDEETEKIIRINNGTPESEVVDSGNTKDAVLLKKRLSFSVFEGAEEIKYTYGSHNYVEKMYIATEKPMDNEKQKNVIVKETYDVTYVYNDKNQVIEEQAEVTENGKKTQTTKTVFHYDAKGYITSSDFKQTIIGGGQGSTYTTYYEYNAQNQVVKKYDKESDGKISSSYRYEYDTNGNLSKRIETENAMNTVSFTYESSKNPLYNCFPKRFKLILLKRHMNNEIYANPNNLKMQIDSNIANKDGLDWIYKYESTLNDKAYPKKMKENLFINNERKSIKVFTYTY